jgi:phospholipid transport system substrate-binding protein
MISRRSMLRLGLVGTAVTAFGRHATALADAPGATATGTIRGFYQTLLDTMKAGARLGFAGRRHRLEPAVEQAFDMPRMTQLAVGLRWRNLTAEQRQELITAFTAYSAATYAGRFADYSGERFDVDGKATPTREGVIVHTKLTPKSGDPVQLDYLMRQTPDGWKIEDVYLSGTVSELATRRSEFSSVLDRGGPQALVDILRKKASTQG